jgi:hypothetical protein
MGYDLARRAFLAGQADRRKADAPGRPTPQRLGRRWSDVCRYGA